jgi:hypothetical protein
MERPSASVIGPTNAVALAGNVGPVGRRLEGVRLEA